jgi:hypothetical protein
MRESYEHSVRRACSVIAAGVALAVTALATVPAWAQSNDASSASSGRAGGAERKLSAAEVRIADVASARLDADRMGLEQFRPAYSFWRHVYTIPDGSVAFGSATDGRLLVVFPAGADWTRAGRWQDPALAELLRGRLLPRDIERRREEVARILADADVPVVHNPTRGRFLLPNAARYGGFLDEWASIYERFGAPANIGLAQAVVESGLSGTARSEARAIGLCQWLEGNWKKLSRLSPHVIEARNQTTQAAYCAAYLTVLATKYGSFVPALSEHHAGGTNVGRVLINGERLGGVDVVSRYFLGSQFALAVRSLSDRDFSELYGTYGPRSFRYAELVFGNVPTVEQLRTTKRQSRIFAMRTPRSIPLGEVTRRTGLSAAEVRRHNPALVRRVPAGGTLYLPVRVSAFGRDVSFWHRPPSSAFTAALEAFVSLEVAPEDWHEARFEQVLRAHQRRFERTRTEEGRIMATVLAYVIDELRTSRRGAILQEYRASERVAELFERAVRATSPPPTSAPAPTAGQAAPNRPIS